MLAGEPDELEPLEELEEQVRGPLEGGAAADAYHLLRQDRLLAAGGPRDGAAEARAFAEHLEDALRGKGECLQPGQRLDRMVGGADQRAELADDRAMQHGGHAAFLSWAAARFQLIKWSRKALTKTSRRF